MHLCLFTGIGFALLYGLYAYVRLDAVTITSKVVKFSPLPLVGTFLLTGCGAFLFLDVRSRLGKGVAVLVATFPSWAGAAIGFGIIAVVNTLAASKMGASFYTHALGLMGSIAFTVECLLVGVAFFALRKWGLQDRVS